MTLPGHRRSWILLGFALLGLLVFVLAAIPVDGGRSPKIEIAAFHAINGMPEILYWPLWGVMQLGNLLALPLAAVVAASTRRFRLALAFLVTVPGKLYLAKLVKANVDRERPASVIDDVIRRGDVSAHGAAFVSGHAIVAFALATVIGPYLTRKWRIAVWILAILVCVARIYVGAHLPLDVVGGAALGWALGSIANLIFGHRRVPESPSGGVL